MWDAFMSFCESLIPLADFLDKPFGAIHKYVPWWCALIIIIGAVVIAVIDNRKYGQKGLGSGYVFWHILFLFLVFIIGGVARVLNVQNEGPLEGSGSVFLFFLVWPLIRFIVLLFKNRKASWWVLPYYILWFVGLLPLIDFIGGAFFGFLAFGAMFKIFLGEGKTVFRLSDGTKVEGYGDGTYHDKYGNPYAKNSDNSFTKKD